MNNFDDILNNASMQTNENLHYSKEEYAVKKQTERDELFTLSSDTVSEISNDGEKLKQYLDVQSHFDRYSAVNAMLIFAQMPNATKLGDFGHWKSKNASIKPNQKAISILEPHEYTKDDGTLGTGYNIKKVFDISQVQASRSMQDLAQPSYSDRQKLAALIHKPPVPILPVDELPDNLGTQINPESGAISVRRNLKFAEMFSSIAASLATLELKYNESHIDKSFSAYCISYLLCKKHGVDTEQFDFSRLGDVFTNLDTQEAKTEFQTIRDTFSNTSFKLSRELESLNKTARNNEAR